MLNLGSLLWICRQPQPEPDPQHLYSSKPHGHLAISALFAHGTRSADKDAQVRASVRRGGKMGHLCDAFFTICIAFATSSGDASKAQAMNAAISASDVIHASFKQLGTQ